METIYPEALRLLTEAAVGATESVTSTKIVPIENLPKEIQEEREEEYATKEDKIFVTIMDNATI